MALSKPKIKFLEKEVKIDIKIIVEKKNTFTLQDLDRDFYPNDHLLSIFAKKAYPDEIRDREYLPPGWVLLMTGYNKNDNYFGAAFWHQENRHLVISHKGTQPTSGKDLHADWQGVVKNEFISQIDSACTFAFKVLTELNTAYFSISITGHSLGGWLAQITTFALEYLTVEDQHFRRLKEEEMEERKWIHPHTVTMDSPGCYNMLCKISEHYFHRYDEKRTDDLISTLDITTYVIAFNKVNTTNQHAGTLLRLDHKVEPRTWAKFIENFIKSPTTIFDDVHTFKYHNKDNFVTALESNETDKFIELNWPIRKISLSKGEYTISFEYANEENNFKPNKRKLESGNEKCVVIPLKEEDYDEEVINANIFFETEKMFLYYWKKLHESKEQTSYIDTFLENKNLEKFANFLKSYDLQIGLGNKIKKIRSKNPNDVINRVKWLFEIFSREAWTAMRDQISISPSLFKALYHSAMHYYDQNLPKYDIIFEDTIGLENFLKIKDQQRKVLLTKNTKDEAFRIRAILQYKCISFCMLSYKDIEYLDKYVDLVKVFASSSEIDKLLIIDMENLEHFKILDSLSNSHKKIICIAENSNFDKTRVRKEMTEIRLRDLDPTSFEILKNRNFISLSGNDECLSNFLSKDNFEALSDSIPFQVLKQNFLISNTITKFTHCNDHFNKVFFNFTTIKVVKDIDINSFEELLNSYESLEAKFIITGVENTCLDELKMKYKDQITLDIESHQDDGFKLFTDLCLKNPTKMIFRLHLKDEHILTWIDVFNPDLRIERTVIINNNTEVNEEELLYSEEQIILISNEAGMGKSTVLLNLANNVDRGWIFWINLIDACKYVKFKKTNLDNVITFMLKFATDSSQLTRILLKFCLVNDGSMPVFLFFDGFDEIQGLKSETKGQVEKKVLEILQVLKNETSAKIFISTRPYECEKLKVKFKVTPIELKEVSKNDQIEFCTKFWVSGSSLLSAKNTKDLNTNANQLLTKFNESIDAETRSFLGIPLQLRIISELFLDSLDDISASTYDFNLYKLYSDFENRKYKVYYDEKLCFETPSAHESRLSETFKTEHRRLGINQLFPEFKTVTDFKNFVDLNRIGLVQVSNVSVSFIHQTFAEFFAADLLVEWLENSPEKKEILEKRFAYDILRSSVYTTVCRFINDKFKFYETDSKTFQFFAHAWGAISDDCEYYKLPYHQDYCKFSVLHTLIKQNNFKLIEMIVDSFNKSKFSEKQEFLNGNLEDDHSPLHASVKYNQEKIALFLLKNGARVNVKAKYDAPSSLHVAAAKPSFNSFSFEALQKVAKREIQWEFDEDFWIVIFLCKNGDLLSRLLPLFENDVQFLKQWGTIMLYIAAESNQIDAARTLIDLNVSFTHKNCEHRDFFKYSRWNLILMAVDMKIQNDSQQKPAELAKKILKMGDNIWNLTLDNVDFKNKKCQTFLHFAVARKEFNQATRLIENNANLLSLDKEGISPAYLATKNNEGWEFILPHFDKIKFKNVKHDKKENVFYIACFLKREDIARKIIEKANPDEVDEIKSTLLLIAAKFRLWTLVTDFLEKGTDVNAVDSDYKPLLHYACEYNKDFALKLIEERKVDINILDEDFWIMIFRDKNDDLLSRLLPLFENDEQFLKQWGTIMLYIAAESNQIDAARTLIDRNVSFTHENCERRDSFKYSRWNLILMAVNMKIQNDSQQKPAELAKKILKMGDNIWNLTLDNVDFKNEKCQTFLHFAVARKEFNQATRLIENNANLFSPDKEGISPVYLATKNNEGWEFILSHFDKIKFKNVKPDKKDNVFYIACFLKREDIARKIIEKANPDEVDEIKSTLLLIAAKFRLWTLVTDFLEKGTDVNAVDSDYKSVLHYACEDNKDFALKLIEERKADINILDKNGNTPLLTAAYNSIWYPVLWDLVDECIKRKYPFDPNKSNNRGETLLHFACEGNKVSSAVDLIQNYKANVNATNKNGHTPLSIAKKKGYTDLASKLISLGENENNPKKPEAVGY